MLLTYANKSVGWVEARNPTYELARCRVPDLLVHTEASLVALSGASRATLTWDMSAPALVVEVVSLGVTNRIRDYQHKYGEYTARGIAEYWIVNPQER
ncbi:hypothetical protein HC928_16400 [bacterium]|nr:hypothetical protein [bacterium]